MKVCTWALSLLSVSFCFQRCEAADETATICRGCSGFWLCSYYSSCESIPVWKGWGTFAGFVFWPISVMTGHRKAWLQHAEGSFSTCLPYPPSYNFPFCHFCPLISILSFLTHLWLINPSWWSMLLSRAVQTRSWRAGVLQSLAPTCLNTPAWKFLVCLVRAWLAASGVFN